MLCDHWVTGWQRPFRVRVLLCKLRIFIRGGVPQGHDNLP